jgi:hypothetical protein
MSALLLELHSKKYHRDYLRRERLLAVNVAPGSIDSYLGVRLDTGMYSDWADKTKYAGLVPTGEYLARCTFCEKVHLVLKYWPHVLLQL